MPELPEVETVVRTLRPMIVGARIQQVILHRPDILRPQGTDLSTALAGRTVTQLQRRGKKILIQFDDNSTLTVHLGMTGQLTVCRPDHPVRPHSHLTLRLP